MLAVCVVFSASSHASVSFKQAQNVYNKICKIAGSCPKLYYDKSSVSNAYSFFYGVAITKGMLRDCQTSADLAMVLGHELGHYVRKDFLFKGSRYKELRADAYGHRLCVAGGYGDCLHFMRLMYSLYGLEEDVEHPTWLVRLEHLQGR